MEEATRESSVVRAGEKEGSRRGGREDCSEEEEEEACSAEMRVRAAARASGEGSVSMSRKDRRVSGMASQGGGWVEMEGERGRTGQGL